MVVNILFEEDDSMVFNTRWRGNNRVEKDRDSWVYLGNLYFHKLVPTNNSHVWWWADPLGKMYPMTAKELTKMLRLTTIKKGKISGRFEAVKMGLTQSLTYIGDK